MNLTDEQVVNLANRAAREVARQYPGVEADDIASEALTRFYEKAHRMKDAEAGYVYRVLERDGLAYAAKVRYERIVETSQYVYTPREIRALLEHAYFDPAVWDVPTDKDDRLSGEIEVESIGVSLMDIREGMNRIKPEHRVILEKRFFRDDTSLHRETVSRAVDALTRAVNRNTAKTGESDDGPGSREVVSNAKAQYRSSSQYETNRYEEDALVKLQKTRNWDRNDPPGTHFNWDKYN